MGFPAYAFNLNNYMMVAHEKGHELMREVEASDDYNEDGVKNAASSEEEFQRADKDLYTVLVRSTSGPPI